MNAAEVEPLLRGRFGRPYTHVEETESTQALIDDDAPEGAVATADVQTAGRGRRGRTWEAPRGSSILCSVALRPPESRRFPDLSLVGGMAAADTVERVLGLSVQIKWPNDVMVNRYKVAGVLAEARGGLVVLGIGINVNQARDELPPTTAAPAASLRTIDGVVRERPPILADLLDDLERTYEAWREGGLDALYDTLGARDFLRGRRVSVDGVAGVATAIDREGRLAVEVGGARRVVESGEVTYEQ